MPLTPSSTLLPTFSWPPSPAGPASRISPHCVHSLSLPIKPQQPPASTEQWDGTQPLKVAPRLQRGLQLPHAPADRVLALRLTKRLPPQGLCISCLFFLLATLVSSAWLSLAPAARSQGSPPQGACLIIPSLFIPPTPHRSLPHRGATTLKLYVAPKSCGPAAVLISPSVTGA